MHNGKWESIIKGKRKLNIDDLSSMDYNDRKL